MKNGDRPAGVMTDPIWLQDNQIKDITGLTKREAFAMAAMNNVYMVTARNVITPKEAASLALEMADDLLAALEVE